MQLHVVNFMRHNVFFSSQLQVAQITKDDLQLLGVTAMFIASKFEEIYPPSVGEFAFITADTYSEERI